MCFTGSPTASRSSTRLKSDETTFGPNGEITSNMGGASGNSKMKKFSSIPNLTQLDDDELTPTVQQPDRLVNIWHIF